MAREGAAASRGASQRPGAPLADNQEQNRCPLTSKPLQKTVYKPASPRWCNGVLVAPLTWCNQGTKPPGRESPLAAPAARDSSSPRLPPRLCLAVGASLLSSAQTRLIGVIKNWLRVLAWAGGTNGAVVTAGAAETARERARGRAPGARSSLEPMLDARWGAVCVLHSLLTRV